MSRPVITCADCQQARPHKARGRCLLCYGRAQRARSLPFTRYRRWTPQEQAYLIRHYRQGPRALARALDRTSEAVELQARKQGIRWRQEYSQKDLALAVGCSQNRVSRWRQAGVLAATGRGYLSEGALHRFFCDHGALWRKYPCPDAAWITSLLTDPRLRRAHGCNSREE